MRKMILGAASALVFASPAVAADLVVTPYAYEGAYEYRTGPPVIVEEAPALVVRRPVIVAPPVVVDEYPVYAAPPVYTYAGPVWHRGWGYRGHFHGGW
jgi:opacity protein-like surface antigen